jgi:transketolase
MSERAASSPRSFEPAAHETMVKTIKALSMDAVQQASSGHPGMPMGTAELATTLWTRFLVHDPTQPDWPDRDRFVLSAGHGSMLLYSLLHLTGYPVPLEELQRFRQMGSMTPGHPELGDTPGVEVTTGPLGTGFAAGVGMALAERILATRYNRPGHTIVDHLVYGIVSDGDLMEGVAAEAASLAGHLGLGKLVYLYDDNAITIDGGTDIAFTEDVGKRFEAYGWHVQKIDGHDAQAITRAIEQARAHGEQPSLIMCRTTIAHGAPNKAGTSASHGSPLGHDEVDATKRAMDWPLEPKFFVPPTLRASLDRAKAALVDARQAWEARMQGYRAAHPDLAAELECLLRGDLPPGTLEALPTFAPGESIATRKAGAKILAALCKVHPTIVGGSADLAESNGVHLPELESQSRTAAGGRIIHYGVREHGMAGITNGLALHGGIRPFDATFLIFSDFMRGCVRLSALMKLPVIHVFSHDSIFLGEDGPTHQPIEQCMSLRMIPNLWVVRPADAKETVGAWKLGLERKAGDGPTAILVTRQNLPTLAESRADISCGAYVLWEPEGTAVSDLHGILVATGSEVPLALEAAKRLHAQGKAVRVVSMPCWEAFAIQDERTRDGVLPPQVTRRLSIEAGTTLGWDRWARHQQGIDRFGASAPAQALAEAFGFTTDAIVAQYLDLP